MRCQSSSEFQSFHNIFLFAISKEAELLQSNGVDIIIALGHSGYEMDQKIAMDCPLVDIVIGGHSHTFLYSGEQPDIEKSEGPYPTVIQQKNGKQVLVVQAYCHNKYLGRLELTVSYSFYMKFESK